MKRCILLCLAILTLILLTACDTNTPDFGVSTAVPLVIPNRLATLEPTPTLGLPAEPTAQPGQTIIMDNQSSWNVCYVYMAPPTNDRWGDDWLGSEEEIEPGNTREFEVETGLWDMRAENCDYMLLSTSSDNNITSTFTWTINDPQIQWQDSFKDDTIWKLLPGSTDKAQYINNALLLTSPTKGGWSSAIAGQSFTDLKAVISTQADKYTLLAKYGAMCRVQPNGDGYAFVIDTTANYSIQKVQAGKWTPLADWKTSKYIKLLTEENILEFTCRAARLTLRVNGHTLITVEDSTFTSGDIGVVAQSDGSSSVSIYFDRLVVLK